MIKYFILILLTKLNYCAVMAQPKGVKAILVKQELVFNKPPFAACHAATIVALPGNMLLGAWFAGAFESSPDVGIWVAAKVNGHWSTPRMIADGVINDTLRFACWNPVLFRTRHGRTMLYYKVGKSPRTWWGMMKFSDDDGKTWSAAEKLPEGILGPIKNKSVQLSDGSILHPSSTESLDEKVWNIHLERSDSLSRYWTKMPIDCDTFGVIQPSILIYSNNRMQLLCRSRQNYIVQTWSTDNGNTWGRLTKTNLPNPNAGSDAVSLQSGLQVLVYNPMPAGKDWFNGRNKLVVAVSEDGNTWHDIYTLENASTGEFSYPAIIQTNDRNLHILYTYDRKNIKHVELTLRNTAK